MRSNHAETGVILLCLLVLGAGTGSAASPAEEAADPLASSVEQLRSAIGAWDVVTEFFNDDGTVGRKTVGTYTFAWVVPDRVVSGRMEIPEMKMASGILFYVNEKAKTIVMVSVGADGHLWVMTGAAGEETRYTQEFPTADGKTAQLRFTRFNISPDRFESRMESTEDAGATWKPGNHQVFTRKQ